MNNTWLISTCRIAIIFLFTAGIFLCLWGYPFIFSFSTVGIVSGVSASSVPVTDYQALSFWTQLIFSYLTTIPYFSMLILMYKATVYAKHNNFFSTENSKIFKTVFIMIFTDSIVFIAGNIVFMALEWNPFAIIFFFTGVCGIIFALFNYFAYRYLTTATKIKEDNDSIL